jgi:hypothetical protein
MLSMPFETAFALLKQRDIPEEDAKKAAEIIDSIPARNVDNGEDTLLQVIEDFCYLYPLDRKQAYELLWACAKKS